jgi:tetratricopeptide (TPR) repeat protein
MKRRSLKQLQRAVEAVSGKREKARAYFNLGVFHDNNSRERQAIPNYKMAIRLGLDRGRETMARAWLASSLFKTGQAKRALKECAQVRRLAKNASLRKFVENLERRIHRSL